jgi:hypothetical protein
VERSALEPEPAPLDDASRLSLGLVWRCLGVAGALLDIPGPATNPGLQPSGLQVPILVTLLAIIVPTTIASWVLLWIGLGGDAVGSSS